MVKGAEVTAPPSKEFGHNCNTLFYCHAVRATFFAFRSAAIALNSDWNSNPPLCVCG